MSCSGADTWSGALDAMTQSLENQEFIDAFTCLYANTGGGLVVVGTLVWFTVAAMSFIRTGSFALPFVYTLLFGGAALVQVVAPALGFVSILLMGGLSVLVVLIARRMGRP